MNIFIGDIDDFYCDTVEGDHRRWAVWSSEVKDGKATEKLLGRFDTERQAEDFADELQGKK